MQKASFNFHAFNLKDRNKALAWVEANKPQSVLVLNNAEFASQCADLGVPYPILRLTTNDDNVHLKIGSFKEWWSFAAPSYQDKRLVVHFDNEPNANLSRLDSIMTEGVEFLVENGYRGAWGNFSVGTPNDSDITNTLRNSLSLLQKYNSTQFLDVHEYWMGILPYNVPYFVSRYRTFLKYYPQLSIFLTEYGTDHILQIAQAHPELGDLRGYKSHVAYYQKSGAKDPEAALMSQYKQSFDQFYNADANVKGVHFFCYGNSGGWDDYDFEGSDLVNSFSLFESGNVTPTNPEQKMINVLAGLNLRSNPSVSSNKITLMPYKSIHTVYDQPIVGADNYNWQRVDSGWAANFVDSAPSWIDVPPPIIWDVKLDVPYYSQRDANSSLKQNDCGYASDRMLMGFDFVRKGLTDPTLISVNDLVQKSPLMTKDVGQQLADVLQVLNGMGVKAHSASGLVADNIRSVLRAGAPLLALVNYKRVNSAQTTDMGHYMVIIGYKNDVFLFHDPYLLGANQIISETNLDLAMSDVVGATGIASIPYQGILLTDS